MKLLSELVREGRERQSTYGDDLEERLEAVAHDCTKVCIDELEAWLREADDYLRRFLEIGKPLKTSFGKGQNSGVKMVLRMVLGTTRPEEKQ